MLCKAANRELDALWCWVAQVLRFGSDKLSETSARKGQCSATSRDKIGCGMWEIGVGILWDLADVGQSHFS